MYRATTTNKNEDKTATKIAHMTRRHEQVTSVQTSNIQIVNLTGKEAQQSVPWAASTSLYSMTTFTISKRIKKKQRTKTPRRQNEKNDKAKEID